MAINIKGMMFASVAALAATAAIPVAQSFGPQGWGATALARGGSDDGGGSSGSGSSGSGSSHSGGSDDHGGRGGNDDRGADDHGRGRGQDDGPNHDLNDDNPGQHRGRNGDRAARPEVTLTVSDTSLRGLLDGSLVAKDQLGRVLEIEVEREHGVRVVTAKIHGSDARRIPGAIDSVDIIPATAQ
ncbi:hypothetical protein QTL95_13895 [Rhizobium sp. S152]|uniref:hypothetical protein n=1 Tax=Rhizobium sp. S152 TaxID=3055038 RepID=UPI0025A9341E|nr:hypothetical protein [Rhizobium sp. S152]MDM9626995.1 hypothetical protein [Rhizobium sp. S152]